MSAASVGDRIVEVATAGDLWKALSEGLKPQIALSGIVLKPGRSISEMDGHTAADQEKRAALDRVQAMLTLESGDQATAMKRLIARVALALNVNRDTVINMRLAEFAAAARGQHDISESSPHQHRGLNAESGAFNVAGQGAGLIAKMAARIPDYLADDYSGPNSNDERRDLLLWLGVSIGEQKGYTDAELDATWRVKLQQKKDVARSAIGGSPAKAAANEPAPPAELQSPSSFIFAANGDGYFVAGFGEQGHVQKLKGFDQILRLIRTPGRPVPMIELAGGADDPRIVADAHSRQPAGDGQTLTQLRERLEGAQADLERAMADNNTVEQDHCREEIDVVKKQLRLLTGIGGKPRDLNSRSNKLRPSIHASLKRAYAKLRKAKPPMNEIASHFKASTTAEADAFVYRPVGTTPAWSFEPPGK